MASTSAAWPPLPWKHTQTRSLAPYSDLESPVHKIYNAKTLRMIGRMHKAISVIQFKLEAEIIGAALISRWTTVCCYRIDFERKTITMPNGKEYELKDSFLPTVNPADPYKLTDEEREIMNRSSSFVSSEVKKTYPLPVPLRMHNEW